MDFSMFKEGDRVVIETAKMMEETEFVTRIEKLEDDSITILSPICKGAILRVPENTRVEMMIFTDGKVYKVKGVSKENFKEGNFHLTSIEINSEVKRFERRSYFRLPIKKPVKVIKLGSEEILNGDILDISGGGIQIKIGEDLYRGQKVNVEIDLDGEQIEICGEVVATIESITDSGFRYGIKFEVENGCFADRIVRYIFSVQRDRLRKDRKVRG